MPKKSILFLVLITVALLCMSGIAQANFAIHGGYLADTDACAGCHRAHTSTSAITWIDKSGTGVRRSALLVGPPTTQVYIFCYVCHSSGAPGAATDVEGGVLDSTSPGGAVEGAHSGNSATDPGPDEAADFSQINQTLNGGGFELLGNDINRPSTSTHEVKGAAWQAWGKDTNIAGYIFMDCCSCHDPHGSSNYRILKDYVNGHWVGGYQTFATLTDPLPRPFVISNEQGYPLAGTNGPAATPSGTHVGAGADSTIIGAATHGFRLHRQYNNGDLVTANYNNGYEYIPSYTKARYARGYEPDSDTLDMDRGMSGWCCACHENYMAGSKPYTTAVGDDEYGDGATSISRWIEDRIAPPGPGTYTGEGLGPPLEKGPTSILVGILDEDITADELHITVIDASGFPDPWGSGGTFAELADGIHYTWTEGTRNTEVQEIKYIGIWGEGDTIMTNEGEITIPKFEMVAYKDIVGNTFVVPNDGRGAFDTAAQAFKTGSKVYLGYDASDGYGDLVRHRHPMNVDFRKWQDALYTGISFVAGDRALVLRPNDWQLFEGDIVQVDIPLDHDPFTEQTIMDTNYDTNNWNNTNTDEGPTTNGYFGANTLEDWIECLTCHRAHGTDATMSGFAGATLMPAQIEGFNTLIPNPGTDDGVPPTGDSALLRADNRGVCERCHNK